MTVVAVTTRTFFPRSGIESFHYHMYHGTILSDKDRRIAVNAFDRPLVICPGIRLFVDEEARDEFAFCHCPFVLWEVAKVFNCPYSLGSTGHWKDQRFLPLQNDIGRFIADELTRVELDKHPIYYELLAPVMKAADFGRTDIKLLHIADPSGSGTSEPKRIVCDLPLLERMRVVWSGGFNLFLRDDFRRVSHHFPEPYFLVRETDV